MFVAAPEYSGQVPNLFAPTEFEGLALNNAVTTIPRTYFASKLSGERINAAGIEVHMNMSNQQANSINRVYLEHEPSALSVLFLSFFRSDDWTPFIRPARAETRTWLRRLFIEDFFLNPAVSVLLLFASPPDCGQNQTAVSDTLRLLSDF